MGCGSSTPNSSPEKKSSSKVKPVNKETQAAKKADTSFLKKNSKGERTLGQREQKLVEEGVDEELLKNLSPQSDKILFMYLRMGSKKKYEDHLIQRQKDLAEIRDKFNGYSDPKGIWNGKGNFLLDLTI